MLRSSEGELELGGSGDELEEEELDDEELDEEELVDEDSSDELEEGSDGGGALLFLDDECVLRFLEDDALLVDGTVITDGTVTKLGGKPVSLLWPEPLIVDASDGK